MFPGWHGAMDQKQTTGEMMDHFEVADLWNYHTDKYQAALIERSFNRGCVHITIHRWL